jgi:outer membrane immunogenic protein
MLRYLVAIIAALSFGLGFPTVASAADLGGPTAPPTYTKAPPVAPFSWTGFYAGIHLGGGSSNTDWFDDGNAVTSLGSGILGLHDASYHATGFLAGGQLGYNYQISWAVLGVEADASWANLRGSMFNCFPEFVSLLAQSCSTHTDALGTVTGRFGAAFDRSLLYVKGGFAWAHESNANPCAALIFQCVSTLATSTDTRIGWTVGAGFEYAFARNWSVRAEYDFMDFGTRDESFLATPTPAPPSPAVLTENIRDRIQVVKVGVNYRFGHWN